MYNWHKFPIGVSALSVDALCTFVKQKCRINLNDEKKNSIINKKESKHFNRTKILILLVIHFYRIAIDSTFELEFES